MQLNARKSGYILAIFLGSWHLLWSILVAVGLAQPLLDFVYYLHFLNNPFHVAVFEPGRALMLIAVTAAIGYVFGWVLAKLWNYVHSK